MFASTHSLKVCAAMMLACAFAFAANSAQAQTNCPDGQENVRGTCRAVCAEGEIRITSQKPGEAWNTGCFPASVGAILDDCEDAGWAGREAASIYSLGDAACEIPSAIFTSTGTAVSSGSECFVHGGKNPDCKSMYGDPPVFPKAAEHPNVNKIVGGNALGDFFFANCDRDGEVPGGYPPDHNLNGATECVCNPSSHWGDWPNCAPGPRLRLRIFLEGPLR